MSTLILDATTKTIKAVMSGAASTTNPTFTSHYADNNGTTFTEGSSDGAFNGTTDVTLVSAPSSGYRRTIKDLTIYNADSTSVTISIKYDNNGTQRTIAKVTLLTGERWTPEVSFDEYGKIKTQVGTGSGGTPGGSDTQVQFNDGGSFGGDAGLTYNKTTDVLTVAGSFNGPHNGTVGATTANTGAFTTLSATGNVSFDGGTFVFNESGADKDFRIEGDTDANLFFTDASTDRVGIGTSSPGYKLNVSGAGYVFGLNGGGTTRVAQTFGNTGGGLDLGIEGSAGGTVFTGGSAYAGVIGTNNATVLQLGTNGTIRATLDTSGNLGLGVTPSAWGSGFKAVQVGARAAFFDTGSTTLVGNNCYYDGTNYKYIAAAYASAYDTTAGQHRWYIAGTGTAGNTITFTQALTLDANRNLLLNGTSAGTSAVGTLTIFNGTAPTGSVTDGIILYAQDVSSSSELKVRDEAGNVTTLSPHNFSLIPDGPSEDMAWAYYSEKGGKRINVDMLKLARMVEKLTGEKLVYES